MKFLSNLAVATDAAGARSVVAAWRERRDALKKARRRRGTDVEALWKARAGRLAGRIRSVLRRGARTVARAAAAEWEHHGLGKAERDDEALIESILARLEADGVAADVIDEITPELRVAFREARIAAVAEVGVESGGEITQHADDAAIEYASMRGAELVTSIRETTREDLRGLIGDALTEGWSADRLADAIEEATAFSSYRAEMIARTELAYAHVGGNLDGWRSTDVVERKRWITGDGCCPECCDLDGVEVELDDMFDYEDGPLDAPPAHPNCRCDVEPVVAPLEEESEETEATA